MLFSTLFFVFSYPAVLHANCPQADKLQTALVEYVHDGDTIRLKDGRKVRLIGINTPELAREQQPKQALASEAKLALQNIIDANNHKIGLSFGIERQDKYGRTLAHLFAQDGSNIQIALIQQGLATAYTTPPNDQYSDCYKAAESIAISNKKGLWALNDFQLKDANKLAPKESGFRRIQGKVLEISTKPNTIWINLENRVKIRIKNKDFNYFDLAKLKQYKNKTIQIHGWLHANKRGYFMNLRHPSALRLSK